MKWKSPLMIADFALFLMCLMVILVLLLLQNHSGKGGYLQVKSPEGTYRYALDKDSLFSVSGLLGITEIEIKNGTVQVLSDPGPRKISVNHAPISASGEWIASLPNQVLLTIVSADTKEGSSTVDDATY